MTYVSSGETKFNGGEIDILLLVGFRTPRTSQDLLQSSIALSSFFPPSSLQWIPQDMGLYLGMNII